MSKTASDAGSQILLYSTQGKGVRQEVGQGLKIAQADQRNGQSAFSIATMNDCNLTEYNFLSLSTSQGFQLVGSIVEIDVDYSFYNVAQGINNTLFLSIGELDPATNQPIQPSYLEIVFLDPGNFSPNDYAGMLTARLNLTYDNATGGALSPFRVEYIETVRRFEIFMAATPDGLSCYIYDKYPMGQIEQGSRPNDTSENQTANQSMGFPKQTGQYVKNFFGAPASAYGNIGYWIIPNGGKVVSPQTIDIRLADAIQISSTYDALSRNSNRALAEETNIITSLSIPPLYGGDEKPPSRLVFRPWDSYYRSTFYINASNLSTLTFRITDIDGRPVEMNGGHYSLRLKISQMPRWNPALEEANEASLQSYLAGIPRFAKKGKDAIKNIKPPKEWKRKLHKIKLNALKHKFLE